MARATLLLAFRGRRGRVSWSCVVVVCRGRVTRVESVRLMIVFVCHLDDLAFMLMSRHTV